MSKQFGLIIPGKTEDKRSVPIFSSKRNVFGGDSESDEEFSSKPKDSLRTNEKTKRQAKIAQAKALEEDPTVFQYDELYDDMAAKKEEAKEAVRAEKKPKYIEKLLESAVKRKKENERRVEREVQKERELEGDKFADKESFVTSAYKKKLQEMAEEEEKEKREAYLEEIGEVTKQRDLGGFYRHLYEQKLRPDISSMSKDDSKIKTESQSEDQKPTTTKANIRKKTLDTEDSKTGAISPEIKKENKLRRKSNDPELSSSNKKPRSYRQRTEIDPEVSDGEIQSDEEINRVNLADLKSGKRAKKEDTNIDADSDFATDSSDDESDGESKDKKSVEEVKSEKLEGGETDLTPKHPCEKSESKGKDKLEQKEENVEETPKIDIWKKRTVGVVFDEALKRYYERKAARGQ